MTDLKQTGAPGGRPSAENVSRQTPGAPSPRVMPPPALAAIALYLLLLAGTISVGVVGHHYPPSFLVLSVLFIAACGGLLMLFRWAWALALAAVLLLSGYNLWVFSSQHQIPSLVQGLLNLIFFLYLVRPEVREKLR